MQNAEAVREAVAGASSEMRQRAMCNVNLSSLLTNEVFNRKRSQNVS